MTLDPQEEWRHRRDRLAAKGLLAGESASLSLRIPDANAMWLGMAEDEVPRRLDRHIATRGATASEAIADVHAAVYAARDDVCAIVIGGGAFGLQLKDFGGAMPGSSTSRCGISAAWQRRWTGSRPSRARSQQVAMRCWSEGGRWCWA